MSDAIAPAYPATDVTPGGAGGGSGGRRRVSFKPWKTRNGRMMLALLVGVAIAVGIYLRRGPAAEPAVPLSTPAQSNADMLAGLGPDPVYAAPIPDGGYDFQNLDPGYADPADEPKPGQPGPTIVINVPPASTVGPTPPPSPTTVLNPPKKGYYRSGWGGAIRFEDGKGHASAYTPDAKRAANIAAAAAEMRRRLKKNRQAGPVALALYGIPHWLRNDGSIDPKGR